MEGGKGRKSETVTITLNKTEFFLQDHVSSLMTTN